jgi:hypothetical protein
MALLYTNVYYKYIHGYFNIDNENYYYYLNNCQHFLDERMLKEEFWGFSFEDYKTCGHGMDILKSYMLEETSSSEILS